MSDKFKRIYLDMDGVLADFGKAFAMRYEDPHDYEEKYGTTRFWEAVYEVPDFFRTMPVFDHTKELIELCKQYSERPLMILSSPSRVNTPLCMAQKREWIDYNISPKFPAIFEKRKHIYAAPRILLIDDYSKKVNAWRKAGGSAHLFKNLDLLKTYLTAGVQQD